MSVTAGDHMAPHLAGKKVLLTGGTGFVGRHLLPHLLAAGAEVTCLTRAVSRTGHLPQGVATAQADLTTGAGLEKALQGKDVVIHMAALLFGLGWQDYLRANALAARSMASALTRLSADGGLGKDFRFVLVSSLAATGPSGTAPGVNDATPSAPVSAYGWSKMLTEQVLGRAVGQSLVTLRPPIIYGSGDKGLLPVFKGVQKAAIAVSPGAGREFYVSALHATDMAQAVLCACKPEARGVYHLSDGEAYTMSAFCQGMGAAMDKVLARTPKDCRKVCIIRMPLPVMACTAGLSTAFAVVADAVLDRLAGHGLRRAPAWNLDKYREARQAGWLCDNSRICAELGFAPRVNLEAGMTEAIEGYRREGWL